MSNFLYLLGGRQRSLVLKSEEECSLYESALILMLNSETGAVRTCVEYKTPPEARPHKHSSIVFKAGTIAGDVLYGEVLYACTGTEVLIYSLPDFKPVGYLSLPAFNDVHHVAVAADGNLLVANTGLDMVLKL